MIGETYGTYKIVSQIGVGGMGAIYLAEHQHLQRRAAIKVLLPEHRQDPQAVQNVLREARATALIRHPGIVEVFDCDVRPDGRAFIVMELLDGVNLGQHLKAVGALDNWTALRLTEQIANVLSAVHRKGIVHRDLKPDNIFLLPAPGRGEPFKVKVLDFGIAKLAFNNPGRTLTRSGQIIGSPPYMSPEQCRGVKRVDHRADIYALGCILYEMLCGQPPFPRQGQGEILVAHVAEVPPRPSSLRPTIPLSVELLLDRMLAKSPGARQASMHEVEQEAAACRVHGLSGRAPRVSQIRPTTQLSPLPFQPRAGNALPVGRRSQLAMGMVALFPGWGPRRASVAALVVGVTLAIAAGLATSRWLSSARRPSRAPGLLATRAQPPPAPPTPAAAAPAALRAPSCVDPLAPVDLPGPLAAVAAVVPHRRTPALRQARPRPAPRPPAADRRGIDLMSFGAAERLERPSRRWIRAAAASAMADLDPMAPGEARARR